MKKLLAKILIFLMYCVSTRSCEGMLGRVNYNFLSWKKKQAHAQMTFKFFSEELFSDEGDCAANGWLKVSTAEGDLDLSPTIKDDANEFDDNCAQEQQVNNLSSSSNGAVEIIINEDGNTPLHLAVLANNLPQVKEFLVTGIDVNVLNNDEETPLMFAARGGFLEIVQHLLLQEDIDVQATNKYGSRASYFAYENGHLQVRNAIFAYFAPGGLWEQRGRKR